MSDITIENPFLEAVTTHLSHICIIQVTDVNNVFAPDGTLASAQRERTRGTRRADTPAPRRRRPRVTSRDNINVDLFAAEAPSYYPSSGILNSHGMFIETPEQFSGAPRAPRNTPPVSLPQPPRTLPIVGSRPGFANQASATAPHPPRAGRHRTAAPPHRCSGHRSAQQPSGHPKESSPSLPHRCERHTKAPSVGAPPTHSASLEEFTGPRPVQFYQPLRLRPSALDSSTAGYELAISQAEAGISRRSEVIFMSRAPAPGSSTQNGPPETFPDWFTAEQREAVPILWNEEMYGETILRCRFCLKPCNVERDICSYCILILAGDSRV